MFSQRDDEHVKYMAIDNANAVDERSITARNNVSFCFFGLQIVGDPKIVRNSVFV